MAAAVVAMIIKVVDIFVPGYPRTKGSLDVVRAATPGRKSIVRESAKDSGVWRRLVAERARASMADRGTLTVPADVAVLVHAHFIFPGEDVLSQFVGDLDKLDRNVLDALQDAKVYVNDRQVTHIVTDKDVDNYSGARIVAYAIEDAYAARGLSDEFAEVIERWTRR